MKFSGRTAAAIVEFPNNQILLIKRATIPFKGCWALPGGKADTRERVEATVVREVKEETGLEVQILTKIGEYHETGLQDGVEYDFYPACFLVKPVGGQMKRQEREIEQMKLFILDRIPERLAFAHNDMIRDYIRRRK
jgi:8-oxo-dGTP diphosphatase